MDKIQNLIPTALTEIADKYIKVKEEECRNKNIRFKKKVIRVAKNFCRDTAMVFIILALIIVGFLFLRKAEND